ncbi:MAG: fibronectin type III domain-containing protein [Kiritimatiellae bacterium]|nr:fibronectin type III domain-containing protein [Kiritimatiellia bacterium]
MNARLSAVGFRVAAWFVLAALSIGTLAFGQAGADMPAGLTASTGGLREVKITWSRPDRTVREYRIDRSESAQGPFITIATVRARDEEYVDTGSSDLPLKDATPYHYRVTPVLRDGSVSAYSQTVRGATAPPPEPPTFLHAEAHYSRGVRLKWNKSSSPGIKVYVLERTAASAPTAFVEIGQTAGTQYEDGGTSESELHDSTEYLYRIMAVNRVNARSRAASFKTVKTLPPPEPVRGLQGKAAEIRCVPLSWAPSPELNVVRYEIHRAETETGQPVKVGAVDGRANAAFLDGRTNPGNLEDDATYYYRIRAINDVGSESAFSDTVKVITRAVPPAVQNVTGVEHQPRRVPLSWEHSPDALVIGYEVWRARAGEDPAQVARVAGRLTTNYLDRGHVDDPGDLGRLADDTDYTYRLVAFNLGYVRASASQPVTIHTKPRPATPAGLYATTDLPHAVKITWKTNPEPDITAYVVEAGKDKDSLDLLARIPGRTNTVTMAAREGRLDSGVTRYYRVKAVDRDRLESNWTDAVKGVAKPIPDPPLNLRVSGVDGGVRVHWNPPAQPDIREYAVWKKKTFAWELFGTTYTPDFVFLEPDLDKPIIVCVTAIDADELESEKSQPMEVRFTRIER